MKPNFAINMTYEGIDLLHRAPNGGWTLVGNVKFDDPASKSALAYLRRTALDLEGKNFTSKLVLPAEEILYITLDAPGPGETERRAQIMAALEGRTPYDIADLAFDWQGDGPSVRVAVVAREIMDQAEEFAATNRFNPVSFVGTPEPGGDGWEPFFGRTDFSYTILGAHEDVRDTPPGTPASATTPRQREEPHPAADSSAPETETGEETGPDTDSSGWNEDPRETGSEASHAGAAAAFPAFTSRRHAAHEDLETGPRPIDRVPHRIALTVPGNISASDGGNKPPSDRQRHAFVPDSANLDAAETTGSAAEPELTPEIIAPEPPPLPKSAARRRKVNFGHVLSSLLQPLKRAFRPKSAADKTVPARKTGMKKGTSALPQGVSAGQWQAMIARLKGNRTALISAIILALMFGVALLYLGMIGGTGQGSKTSDVSLVNTRLTERSRATTPPPARPADGRARTPPVLRPERGGIGGAQDTRRIGRILPPEDKSARQTSAGDLVAGDTALPVKKLTRQELADIRAAGLPPPTPEELAEGAEAALTNAEIATIYEKTGLLVGVGEPPQPVVQSRRGDIYIPSVDPDLGAGDAIILPDYGNGIGETPPERMRSPLGPDVAFDVDENGLVKPTPKGALNPDGILVLAGKPPVVPPKKPAITVIAPPNPLRALKPRPRPANLKTGADAIYAQGRLTLRQLQAFRPKPRPASAQDAGIAGGGAGGSKLAVMASPRPTARPSDFATIVRQTRRKMASLAPAAPTGPVRVKPLPAKANVAKHATRKRALNLRQLNLIGVYGTADRRRALLRLPSGRYVKVRKGDRVAGGQVAAIGRNFISYVKDGRNRRLKIPDRP
ncbi:MAG: hypothetical protein Q9M41_03640 [Paracoccaceae bacterium]|nr:hypothetical protein [Paracoccaceae bacterium]